VVLFIRTRGVAARVVVGGALICSMFAWAGCAAVPGESAGGSAGASGASGASSNAASSPTSPGAANTPAGSITDPNGAPGDGSPDPAGPHQSIGPKGSSGLMTLPPTPAASASQVQPSASQPSAEPRPSSRPSATPPPALPAVPAPRPDPNRLYQVPVLMYHRVLPLEQAGNSASGLVVPPTVFSAQLKALYDAGWHTITMATLADRMAHDATIPAKTFVLTFDDGWEDGYTYAFPIMRGFGFVGTFFMISSRIDTEDCLTTAEMRTLEAAGNEIGNHTENHLSLASVSLDRVKDEVENGSEQIARATGHRPVSLSYPMGGVSDAVIWVVSQVPDIQIAVTTGHGKTETWPARYNVPRLRVNPTTDPDRVVPWVSP
jgi:peptidoglycan/xylan/chitin deacetylase (PgdA/CDA1 family)